MNMTNIHFLGWSWHQPYKTTIWKEINLKLANFGKFVVFVKKHFGLKMKTKIFNHHWAPHHHHAPPINRGFFEPHRGSPPLRWHRSHRETIGLQRNTDCGNQWLGTAGNPGNPRVVGFLIKLVVDLKVFQSYLLRVFGVLWICFWGSK